MRRKELFRRAFFMIGAGGILLYWWILLRPKLPMVDRAVAPDHIHSADSATQLRVYFFIYGILLLGSLLVSLGVVACIVGIFKK